MFACADVMKKLFDDDLRFMMRDDLIAAHRERALTPDRPVLRGSAQNPDAFFQAREACNRYYDACPAHVQDAMDQAIRDSGGKVAIVAHKRGFRRWLVTMEAETFFEFLRGTLPRQSTGAGRQESTETAEQQENKDV